MSTDRREERYVPKIFTRNCICIHSICMQEPQEAASLIAIAFSSVSFVAKALPYILF